MGDEETIEVVHAPATRLGTPRIGRISIVEAFGPAEVWRSRHSMRFGGDDVRAGNYSLHVCVHDWTLKFLTPIFNDNLCLLAVHCIGQSVQSDAEAEYWVGNRRLLQHVQRVEHDHVKGSIDWSSTEIADLHNIAYLYSQLGMNVEAETMYLRGYASFRG